MCGRARCTLRPDDFPRACHLNGRRVRHIDMNRYQPSYNVSPGFNVPVVRREDDLNDDGAVVHCMKWGLVPSFTKKTEKPDHYKMFNARSESIKAKASFRRLVPKNRCLVAVEGFYEWKNDGSKKQPYYIHFKDGQPLVFAALYDSWKNPKGEVLYTFTILTTSVSSSLVWLHDRMPVILGNKDAADMWLSGSPSSNIDTLLKPYEESDLVWYPVTPAMGKASFGGPECIKELQLKANETRTIAQYFSKKGDKDEQGQKSHIKVAEEEILSTDQTESLKHEPESDHVGHLCSPVRLESFTSTRATDIKVEQDYDESGSKQSSTWQTGNPPEKVGILANDNVKSLEEVETEDIKPNVFALPWEESGDSKTKRDYEEFSGNVMRLAKRVNKHLSPSKKKAKGAGDKQPTLFSYFGKG
ncbi:abasic site processing protein YoqW [Capsicum galapagoense]